MYKAPRHLKAATRKWAEQITVDYDLEEHHERLLEGAATAWDRAQEARLTLSKSGATYTNKDGEPRAHPSVKIERDSMLTFARLLRELGLDISAPQPASMPRAFGARR